MVRVELYDMQREPPENINNYLVKKNIAERAEEPYVSKVRVYTLSCLSKLIWLYVHFLTGSKMGTLCVFVGDKVEKLFGHIDKILEKTLGHIEKALRQC